MPLPCLRKTLSEWELRCSSFGAPMYRLLHLFRIWMRMRARHMSAGTIAPPVNSRALFSGDVWSGNPVPKSRLSRAIWRTAAGKIAKSDFARCGGGVFLRSTLSSLSRRMTRRNRPVKPPCVRSYPIIQSALSPRASSPILQSWNNHQLHLREGQAGLT
jgi:hypothetical protein